MNRERIEKLRDFLRDEVADGGFDMENTGGALWDGCGSVACIGGWARHLFLAREDDFLGLHQVGTKLLGLTYEQAGNLFFAYNTDATFAEIDRVRAIATLNRLLETGEVDWGQS